ncbi:hypothetical protein SAMN05216351_10820 [Pseudobutyrivibrio sp. JW11]|uniref:AAA family ATPase n=1 Tax=Pseudobutyrivibrio sp. JW11 TaxID=1855302 RepID=UPI0008EC6604|nr:ATP-binding protein [Pseudobutyrivibrio sp. JW11]SFO38076.1 hypothetical protein SAMN05216351_10820 [Pseudobutyrivibrio sp. JW11]
MLIQFTVENFMSIKEKAYISLEPSVDKAHPENLISNEQESALNTILIYGANASGKSVLFKAMTVAIVMVRNSNNTQITDKLPVVPFKFDKETLTKPSSFEFTFVAADNKKYIYGFSATSEKVIEEYLYVYNTAKPTLLFDIKEQDEPNFNREYRAKLGAAYKMNTANKLFLATATSWNVECTSTPFKWLAEGIDTYSEIMNMGGVALDKYRNDDKGEYISFTKELLKQADINISDISIDIKEIFPSDNLFPGQGIYPVNADSAFSVEVITGHIIKKVDGTEEKYNLHIQDESLGTQQLFNYGPLLKDAMDYGKTIVLDEIDKSMHPMLVKYIVNLFRNPELNKNGAQLIATTHETTVLSLDTLRRDQIYFTEKDNKTGETDVYSLDEFSVRKSENIEKGYLLGRYGAIPFLQTEEVW